MLPDTPGLIRYQHFLKNGREAFIEVSGFLEEDDPLEDFTGYLQDPVNWDPTQFIDRRFVYDADIGIQQQSSFLEGIHAIRAGLQAHAEDAHARYVSLTNFQTLGAADHVNLIDIGYSSYITLRSSPLDWITFNGDARIHFLHYDTQNVCRTTCSLQPNNLEDRVIPSIRGNLTIRPWHNTFFFMNIGTGYHSFQDREPVGSTSIEQLTQATSYELGMRMLTFQGIKISTSFWQVNLGTDRLFFEKGEKVQVTGPSRRRGIQMKVNLSRLEDITISGNLTYAQTTLRRTRGRIPLSPTLTFKTSVNKNWGKRWSSTLNIRHIGKRTDSENLGAKLRPFTTVDLTSNYQLKESTSKDQIEIFFGVINFSNTVEPNAQFFFDAELHTEYSQVFNNYYFPGQPRTIVGGMTWEF